MAIETESPFRCVWTGTLSASGSLGRTAVGPVMQCLHFSVEHSTDPQLLFHLESDSMSQAGKKTPLLNRPVLERLTPKQAGGEPRGSLANPAKPSAVRPARPCAREGEDLPGSHCAGPITFSNSVPMLGGQQNSTGIWAPNSLSSAQKALHISRKSVTDL